jgi:predicted TIM-barrel fold metal-dependent hydrolase
VILTPQTRPHRIDVHHHHASPAFIAEIKARQTGQQPLMDWTPARSIAEMDRAGVQTAMTSVAPPGVWFGDNGTARALARECNEYAARLAADFPGRFGVFAALPLPDVEGSLAEIAYAFDVLEADGVGLMTSVGNKWLGDRAFAPVMDELNRRKAVVYVHPTVAHCCRDLIDEVPDHLIEFATDKTRTIASLMLTGTAYRCADIRFIFAHAGGTMPFITERMTWWAGVRTELRAQMPQGPLHELRRFFYDTAFAANPYALSSLLQLVSVSQVLYGTDFPFRGCLENIEGLNAYGFGPDDLRAIERENALRILPRLRR